MVLTSEVGDNCWKTDSLLFIVNHDLFMIDCKKFAKLLSLGDSIPKGGTYGNFVKFCFIFSRGEYSRISIM